MEELISLENNLGEQLIVSSGFGNHKENEICIYDDYIKAIVEKYKSQYERQQNQKNIETAQHDALFNIISVALDGTKDTIAVSGGYGNKTLAEFGEQVDDACLLPIAEVVKGIELDYHIYTAKIRPLNKHGILTL